MAITVSNAQALVAERAAVYTGDGELVGSLTDVFFDTGTGVPNWALVEVGSESGARFVPLTGAEILSAGLHVPLAHAVIARSPAASRPGPPDPDTEQQLSSYYQSVQSGERQADDLSPKPAAGSADDDDVMIVSEERLRTGTEVRPSSRVKITKQIVTEQVTQTVPVRREELRIERIPIEADSSGDPGTAGIEGDHHEFGQGEYEIVLYEERVVVTTVVVPVERVRLNTQTVTEDVVVTEDLRKEHVKLSEQQT